MASSKAFQASEDKHLISTEPFPEAARPVDSEQRLVARTQSAWRHPTCVIDQVMVDDTFVTLCNENIPFWGFAGSSACGRPWAPSVVRVRDQDLVQLRLQMPKPWIDRNQLPEVVMKQSAPRCATSDSSGYIYQWRATNAGTWLFQPHDATAHDFEMGLYGMLIVEPARSEDGRRRVYPGGPCYDIERCLILDDVDPRWHDAGFKVTHTNLLQFRPDYFLVNGLPSTCSEDSPSCAISALSGQRVLLRLLNASFSLLRFSLRGLSAEVVVIDGDILGNPQRPWSKSKHLQPNEPLHLATGSRVDLIIDLGVQAEHVSGRFPITFEFLDPRDRKVRNANSASSVNRGIATTLLTVGTPSSGF